MPSATCFLLCVALSLLSLTPASAAELFFRQDFDNDTYGTYLRSEYEADFPDANNPAGVDPSATAFNGRAYISGYAYEGAYGLKMKSAQGQAGGSSGFSFKMPFQDAGGSDVEYDDVYLKYNLRFLDGFDFQNGGKLPGIGSDNGYAVGGRTVDSDPNDQFTDYDQIGWTVRTFFDNVDGHSPDSAQGRLGMYVYHYDRPNDTGDPMFFQDNLGQAGETDFIVSTNQWYEVTIRVQVNSGGGNDGVLRAWIDGNLVIHSSSMRWGEDELNPADTLLFHYFHGGSNPATFAPDVDSYVAIDDVRLYHAPEPAALGMMAMGAGVMMLRRRSQSINPN